VRHDPEDLPPATLVRLLGRPVVSLQLVHAQVGPKMNASCRVPILQEPSKGWYECAVSLRRAVVYAGVELQVRGEPASEGTSRAPHDRACCRTRRTNCWGTSNQADFLVFLGSISTREQVSVSAAAVGLAAATNWHVFCWVGMLPAIAKGEACGVWPHVTFRYLVRCTLDEGDVEVVKPVSHTGAHPECVVCRHAVLRHCCSTVGGGDATRLASLNRLTSATGAPRWEALPTGGRGGVSMQPIKARLGTWFSTLKRIAPIRQPPAPTGVAGLWARIRAWLGRLWPKRS
jgi:hypothetical protein